MLSDSEVERVLVITAHPDDLDFGAAGTIAKWTDQQIEVSYCICTDGDAGGFDPTVPRSDIPGIRQDEQRRAAEALGVPADRIHFLGYRDGYLAPTFDLRRDISRVIRQVRPQRALCQSPERNYQRIYASHPDHLAAGEAAMCAIYPDAQNPFAHPSLLEEGYQEWNVLEAWIMAGPTNNHTVDITDYVDRKLDALRAHVSQTAHMGAELEARIRDWNSTNARDAGLPDGRLAESFFVMDTK